MKKIYSVTLIIAVIFVIVLIAFPYPEKSAKVLFVGDMFFDRYIRLVSYNKGEDFTFSCIGSFLKDSDLVVGNLEGPITDNPSSSLGTVPGGNGNYTFTFPSRIAALLAKNNIKLVNLGNNHIGNFGQAGIISTRKYLDEAHVKYFGLPREASAEWGGDIYRTEVGGTKISFISFNEFGGDSPEKVAQKIITEKANKQTVVVYAHWGDEYIAVPQRVKATAKLFVQSGADFIVGSHPHIILPSEKIGNAEVYYSLGNFIFDQYWDKEVSTGLALEIDIKGKPADWQIIEHKVSLNKDGKTCLIPDKN
jgi:poly-gamma-glutamate capsule biosynthesis protein CapA/YwtB (metallophosphatase superfamily)